MSRICKAFELNDTIDDKYRLIRPIGRGGMGEVYEACHVEIGCPVAIKTLRPEYVENDTAISRFYREARLAGSLGHDHICQVTDVGRHNDIPYLVMPLLKGSTLSELLNSRTLTIGCLIDIICQVLSALSAAHRQSIVHRDLKPSNIFVTKIGKQSNFVKLLDFGISKVLHADSTVNTTLFGAVPGTTHYMSPEQAMGMRDIDQRVDIYAVGVILYRCITGRFPFDGDTNNEILYKISSSACIPPRRNNPGIPRRLEGIVLKAMARDPLKRYQSADNMRRALESLSLGEYGRAAAFKDTSTTSTVTKASPSLSTVSATCSAITYAPLPMQDSYWRPQKSHLVFGLLLVTVLATSGYGFYKKSENSQVAPGLEKPPAPAGVGRMLQQMASKASSPGTLSTMKISSPLNANSLSSTDEAISEAAPPPPSQRRTAAVHATGKSHKKMTKPTKSRRRKERGLARKTENRIFSTKSIKGPLGAEISLEYDPYQ